MLAAPILTRLYSPSDFGTAALFAATLSILASFCTWRFDWSVPNARTKAMAASLITLGLSILLTLTIAVTLSVVFLDQWLSVWSGFVTLGNLALWLPVALLGSGIALLLRGWFIRENDLTDSSRSRIVESTANVAASLVGGAATLGAAGLITARVLSTWAGLPLLLRHAQPLIAETFRPSFKRLRSAYGRFYREATWSTVSALINTASLSAPLVLLSQFYSVHEIGWYSLMTTLAISPISVFSAALGQSFWSEAAQLARGRNFKRIRSLYLRTTKRLAVAGLIAAAACTLGPYFVGPLFGEEDWGGAGFVLMAIAPALFGSITFSPTNHLIVLSRQSLQVAADGIRLVLMIAAILLAQTFDFSFATAVAFIATSSLIGHLCLFYLHLKVHASYERRKTVLGSANF